MVPPTLLQIAIGLLAPVLLARWARRRWDVPLLLLVPGALAALAVLIAGPLLESVAAAAVASGQMPASPSDVTALVLVGTVGLLHGLLVAGALAITFVYLARTARTFPQALMVGVGFGGTEVVLRAALALLVLLATLRLAGQDPAAWNLPPDEAALRQAELDAYFARPPLEPLLEAVVGLGRVALGLALSVLVGRVFITGEIGYFFGALWWAALTTAAPLIFGQAGPLAVTAVWTIIGLASVGLSRQLSAISPLR